MMMTLCLKRYFPQTKKLIQRFQVNFLCDNSNNVISNTLGSKLPEKSTTVILLTSEAHHLWHSRVQLTSHAPRESPLHVQNCKSPLRCDKMSAVNAKNCQISVLSFPVHTKLLVIILISHVFFFWKLMHRLNELPTWRFQMFSLSLEILSTVWPISAMSMLSSRM